jgi:hypothetical protein
MPVRPYRLSGSSALRRVTEAYAKAAADWASSWGIEAGAVSVQCMPAADAPGPEREPGYLWRQRWSRSGASAWCTWSAQAGTEFGRLMFPGGEGELVAESSFAPGIGGNALDAVLHGLQHTGGGETPAVTQLQPAPDDAPSHASGFIVVAVQVGPVRLRLLADAEWVAQAQAGVPGAAALALPPLRPVALGKSLEQVAVPLTVIAGEVEIGAGAMLSIGVGDVIRLDTAADQPFALALPGGATLCHGLIGRRGDSLAVEVTLHS